MASTRPETGDIRPGMTMFVRRSPNDSRRRPASERYIEVTVTSAARVWIVVVATDGRNSWRIRRDTMDEATRFSGSNAHLVTPEQRSWDVRQHTARQYLDDQGITLEGRSPWRGKEHILADLLRGADA